MSRVLVMVLLVFGFPMGLAAFMHVAAQQPGPFPPAPIALYHDVPLDADLLRMDKRALEDAYHAHLLKLFDVWMSSQPNEAAARQSSLRLQSGLRIVRRAYRQAADQIAQREKELLDKPEVVP